MRILLLFLYTFMEDEFVWKKKKDPKLAISVFRLLGRSLNRMPYVCLMNRNSLIFTNTECPQFPVTSMGSEEHH